MFDYDWFHGVAYEQQRSEARSRCSRLHFPDISAEKQEKDADFAKFHEELLIRTLIYLRDGFSYEVKEIAEVATKSHLVFECEPVDQQYKVGSFVVTVPFEEIVRVEVFAVHPDSKPEDFPQITGFHASPETGDHKFPEAPPPGKHAH